MPKLLAKKIEALWESSLSAGFKNLTNYKETKLKKYEEKPEKNKLSKKLSSSSTKSSDLVSKIDDIDKKHTKKSSHSSLLAKKKLQGGK